MSKMVNHSYLPNYSILNDFSLEIENAYLRLLLTVIDESSCIGWICKAKSQKSSGHAMRFILLCFHDKECWMSDHSTVTRKHFIPRIFPSKSGGIKESSQNARRPRPPHTASPTQLHTAQLSRSARAANQVLACTSVIGRAWLRWRLRGAVSYN